MNIEINTPYIKLDQLMKYAGIVGNGSDAKLLIQDGLVQVNGAVVTQRGKKIQKGDTVTVGEQVLYVC